MAESTDQERRIDALQTAVRDVAADVKAYRIEFAASIARVEALIPLRLGEQMVTLGVKLDSAIRDLSDLRTLIRSDLISRTEFDPVKQVVYGVVALILTAVVGALIALVVNR